MNVRAPESDTSVPDTNPLACLLQITIADRTVGLAGGVEMLLKAAFVKAMAAGGHDPPCRALAQAVAAATPMLTLRIGDPGHKLGAGRDVRRAGVDFPRHGNLTRKRRDAAATQISPEHASELSDSDVGHIQLATIHGSVHASVGVADLEMKRNG
jgi:hypothetical protein